MSGACLGGTHLGIGRLDAPTGDPQRRASPEEKCGRTVVDDIGDSFRNVLDDVISFLPKLLVFLVILVVGYFIAKLLAKIVDKVLERVGFDRAVERGGVKTALARSQYDASDIMAKIVFYAVMLFVLSTAFGVFGDNPISDYLRAIVAYLPRVFVA